MKSPTRTQKATRPDNPPTHLLTARDYFAGQALAGVIAYFGNAVTDDAASRRAYVAADAMLKERAK